MRRQREGIGGFFHGRIPQWAARRPKPVVRASRPGLLGAAGISGGGAPIPICTGARAWADPRDPPRAIRRGASSIDRKSTRLNSSHLGISYAVFCLKKKKKKKYTQAISTPLTTHATAQAVARPF